MAISFGQDLGDSDTAVTTEAAIEQNNEANDDLTASSGDDDGNTATEANEPSGDADVGGTSAEGDNDAAVANGDSSENSEAATTAAAPEDGNASSSSENAESGDNAAGAADNSNSDTSSDASSGTAEAPTTAAAPAEESSPASAPSTEAPEFKCDSVGRFACPHSCEKYYFCWDTTGDHAVFSCPHHRAFDPNTQLCVHNFAVCAAAPKCEVDRQVLPDPDEKTSFFECRLEEKDDDDEEDEDSAETFEVRKQECHEGREFDADLGYCKLTPVNDESGDEGSEEKQDCTEVGIFIDFANESRYYECIIKSVAKGKLKLIHHKCPKYHVFSMADKKCIPLLPVTAQ